MTFISQPRAVDEAIRFLISDDAVSGTVPTSDGIVAGPPYGSPLYTDLPGRTTTVGVVSPGPDAVGNPIVAPSWEVSFPRSNTNLIGGEPHVFVSQDDSYPNISTRFTAQGVPYQAFFVQDAFYTQ